MSIENIKLSQLGEFVSISLDYNPENKTGIALAGQIFKNLKDMTSTKLARLEYTIKSKFKEGSWINSKAVYNQLLNQVKNLQTGLEEMTLKKMSSKEQGLPSNMTHILTDIEQMNKVCKLLENNKLIKVDAKELNIDLSKLKEIIEKKLEEVKEIHKPSQRITSEKEHELVIEQRKVSSEKLQEKIPEQPREKSAEQTPAPETKKPEKIPKLTWLEVTDLKEGNLKLEKESRN